MKTKILIPVLTVFSFFEIGYAQNPEATDSLTRELQEIVVTAEQPATKLVGSTLVSTIPGTNLADLAPLSMFSRSCR